MPGARKRARDPLEERTTASLWQAVAGCAITDELLEWPPDVFALTNVVLDRSGAYRFLFSAPDSVEWPPIRFVSWSDSVEEVGRQWSGWVEDRRGPLPTLLAEEWSAFRDRAGKPMKDLVEGRDWRMCEALLTLHAIADEACAGLGVALDRSDGQGCVYRARGRELLAQTGSLARIDPQLVRVLPKVRTPLSDTNVSSLSRYACVLGPGVEARWYKMPARRRGTGPQAEHTNLLLLPWPLRVRESDFRAVDGSVKRLAKEPFGLFEFAPAEGLDFDLVDRMLVEALDEVDSVDVVLLPESAVDDTDIDDLEALLDRHRVGYLVTGVRERSGQPGRLPGNWVHFSVSPRLEKGGPTPGSGDQRWFHIRQDKHHRWSLDEAQVNQYHLGGALHPHIRWWEATQVPPRTIAFVEAHELTIAVLVCEDLAQSDNVAEVIRAVGPTLLVTPLLDGPQLTSRWSARYASVFADDPGSAVLTVTSYGLVQRSRPHGQDASSVVALWKAPGRGAREIRLEPGAQGVLVTACTDRATRRSTDGRWPIDNATDYFDVASYQVRASVTGSGLLESRSKPPAPGVLCVEDLTILTGWAQGVSEALAYAPECSLALLDDARAGAAWRTELGIAEPSLALCEAIDCLAEAVRASATSAGMPAFDAVVLAAQEEQADRPVARVARRVLRSTLEMLSSRESRDTDEHQRSGPTAPRG